MASSQAKSNLASTLQLLRNPLKLLKQKGSIVPALGHVFDSTLGCTHCGRMWYAQRVEPTACGASPASIAAREPVTPAGPVIPDEPVVQSPDIANPGGDDQD